MLARLKIKKDPVLLPLLHHRIHLFERRIVLYVDRLLPQRYPFLYYLCPSVSPSFSSGQTEHAAEIKEEKENGMRGLKQSAR